MPKAVSRRELIRRFKRLGFSGPFSGAKHDFMERAELRVRIPGRHEGDISGPLVREILRQAGILLTEWEEVH